LLLGAVAGWAAGQRVSASGRSGAVWLAFWLAIPIGVCAISPAGWLQIVETAYLTETTAWSLARASLFAAMLPLLLSGVSAVPGVALDPRALRRGKRADRLLWIVLAVGAVGLGGKGLGLVGIGLLVLFLALPGWWVFRENLPIDPWLRRDLPALVAIVVCGWGVGTLIALLWRWALLMSSLSTLVRYAPRATAEMAFVMLLALPLTAEAAARSSYLEQVWTPEGVQVGFISEQGSDEVALGWTGSCGPTTATEVYRVAYAGGSSTGGAYQFGNDSEAFFPAQAHRLLCAARPAGVRLESFNFGDGDRTSFTISRTLKQLVDVAHPDVLVLYLGVNDIFTQRHGKTSKEREAERAARSGSENLLGRVGASSRLVVGLGAALRSSQRGRRTYVSDVPVDDAAENLKQIAGVLGEASVVLMTEQVQSGNRAVLQPYDVMQRRVAEAVGSVHFVDVQAGLGEGRVDAFLADRNHLTREGNREVAGLLAPELRRLLQWTQPE
jgi:lysophospholipase L1-like esterase